MSPIHMLAGIQVGHHGFYVDLQIELKCQMVKLRYWREKWTHLVTSHERHGLSNHRLFFQQLVQAKTNENIPWWWESVNNGFPSYIHWCGKRFHVMTSSGPIYHYNPSYTSTQHIMFHTFTEHTVREVMTNGTSCQYDNANGQFLYEKSLSLMLQYMKLALWVCIWFIWTHAFCHIHFHPFIQTQHHTANLLYECFVSCTICIKLHEIHDKNITFVNQIDL